MAIHKECGAECNNTTGTGRLGQTYYYLKCSKCGKYFSETKIIQMLEIAYGGFVNQMNSYNATLKIKEINNQRDDLVSMYTKKLISGESFIRASARLDEMARAEQLKENTYQYTTNMFNSSDRRIVKDIINDVVVDLEINDKKEYIVFRFKKDIEIVVSYDLKYVKIYE